MKVAKRIFSKKLTVSQKILFWQFIGPLSFVFTSTLFTLNKTANTDLFLCMFFGTLLIWKDLRKGWIFATALWLISIAFKHLQLEEGHLWQFGLEFSVALGCLLTYLCLKESAQKVHAIDSERQDQLDRTLFLEETFIQKQKQLESEKGLLEDRFSLLKKELAESEQKLHSLEQLTDALRYSLEEKEHVKEQDQYTKTEKDRTISQLQFEVVDLKEKLKALDDIDSIRANNQKLLKEVNQYRVSAYQSELLVKGLQEQLEKSKKQVANLETEEKLLQSQRVIESLEQKLNENQLQANEDKYETLKLAFDKNVELLKSYEERFKELKPSEDALKQLRKQFVQKNEVLQQARKELFEMETELLALKKEQQRIEEEGIVDLSDIVKDCERLYESYSSLNAENAELTSIIDELLNIEPEDNS